MDTKMRHVAWAELANATRRRYRSATSKQKRKTLDELVAATGYRQKSPIRVLNSQPTKPRSRRNRQSIYN